MVQAMPVDIHGTIGLGIEGLVPPFGDGDDGRRFK